MSAVPSQEMVVGMQLEPAEQSSGVWKIEKKKEEKSGWRLQRKQLARDDGGNGDKLKEVYF